MKWWNTLYLNEGMYDLFGNGEEISRLTFLFE